MFKIVKAGLGRLFGSPLEPEPAVTTTPIIGACVATGAASATGSRRAEVANAAAAMTMEPNIAAASPKLVPMFGTRRGRDYAETYAAAFVTAVRTAMRGSPVTWSVDEVLSNSIKGFADANKIPAPPDRSLLSVMKRMPGITVRQDVRGRRADGSKATV